MTLSDTIYIATIIERIHNVSIVFMALSLIGGGFCLFHSLIEREKYAAAIAKPLLLFAAILVLVVVFLPPLECVYSSYITNHPTANLIWNKFVCYLTGKMW